MIKISSLYEQFSTDLVQDVLKNYFHFTEFNEHTLIDIDFAIKICDKLYNNLITDTEEFALMDDFNPFDIDDEDDDDSCDQFWLDKPSKSHMRFTHGCLGCPCCGGIYNTYTDGTAYCNRCHIWYCYA